MDLCSYLFCLSFYLLYFFLSPFEDNGLTFWVPDVLCQHSEVVLWNLLSVQMFFWWICGGESGFPVLFLHHCRTPPVPPGSFQMSQFFTSSGQSIGISASASGLPMNIQDWLPLRWTGWISSLSKRCSRVFNTTVQKHWFFGAQLSL